MRSKINLFTVLSVVLAVVLLLLPVRANANAKTPNPDYPGFNRELILRDELLYNRGWMDRAQIAAFINRWGARCHTQPGQVPCLKDALIDTPDIERYVVTNHNPDFGSERPVVVCEPLRGGTQEPVADVIARISQACQVNPQFLLTNLQKEMSLIQSMNPTLRNYKYGLGVGCPDSKPCDPKKSGLGRQLYLAARQISVYRYLSWTYRRGEVKVFAEKNKNKQMDPDCVSTVTFKNYATAALYQYTPHATSDKFLRHEGECVSQGDLSFWRIFKRYFVRPNTDVKAFSDVSATDAFASDIWWMKEQKLSTGWPDRTYRRLLPVQRDAVVAFLHRLHLKSTKKDTHKTVRDIEFSDVTPKTPFRHEISWAVKNGLVKGWKDKTFRPTLPVERAALAAILKRYCQQYGDTCEGTKYPGKTRVKPFKDVTKSNQFYSEVTWARNAGLVTGWNDGTFRPVDPVNRDAMAAIVHRLSVGP